MRTLKGGLQRTETLIHLVAAAFLLIAAAFTAVGTVIDLVQGSGSRRIADAGVFLLDRVLLLFIITELLYTLRLVNGHGRILVEPFLFIGLIAVVRRILVVTAETELQDSQLTDFVIEMGGLGAVVLVLALAIRLLRGSSGPQP